MLQGRFIELGFRQQLLQPCVLVLKFAQTTRPDTVIPAYLAFQL